jgi:predicted kinase
MTNKKIFLMSGPPGCGKSTWVREHMTSADEWISRDKVRFSIVGEDEPYFSHEEEVFDTFIAYINQTLERPEVEHVYIDATHINRKSRQNVLSKIHMNNVAEVNSVWFVVPKRICLERNAKRSGRECVPDSAIENMFNGLVFPTPEEHFDHIYLVNENGITSEV